MDPRACNILAFTAILLLAFTSRASSEGHGVLGQVAENLHSPPFGVMRPADFNPVANVSAVETKNVERRKRALQKKRRQVGLEISHDSDHDENYPTSVITARYTIAAHSIAKRQQPDFPTPKTKQLKTDSIAESNKVRRQIKDGSEAGDLSGVTGLPPRFDKIGVTLIPPVNFQGSKFFVETPNQEENGGKNHRKSLDKRDFHTLDSTKRRQTTTQKKTTESSVHRERNQQGGTGLQTPGPFLGI